MESFETLEPEDESLCEDYYEQPSFEDPDSDSDCELPVPKKKMRSGKISVLFGFIWKILVII
jgi:hypothetical protein